MKTKTKSSLIASFLFLSMISCAPDSIVAPVVTNSPPAWIYGTWSSPDARHWAFFDERQAWHTFDGVTTSFQDATCEFDEGGSFIVRTGNETYTYQRTATNPS